MSIGELRRDVVASPGDRGEQPRARRRTWSWWLGGVGRALVVVSVLTLLFAGYQLWGTGLTHARSQAELEDEFEERLAAMTKTPASSIPAAPVPSTAAPDMTTVAPGPSTAAAPTVAASAAPAVTPAPVAEAIARGEGIARLVIPDIDVDEIVVPGVGRDDLHRGPGHYPGTPLPGELGNAGIAGHRTTYGAPFGRLDELEIGDAIEVTTFSGDFRYLVTEQLIVDPDDTYVLDPTPGATLTLTACHPKYSDRDRLVIKAALDDGASATPTAATPNAYPTGGGQPDNEAATETTAPAPSPPSIDTGDLNAGWFSDPAAWFPTMAWAAAGIGVAFTARRLGRRGRHLLVYAAAAVPLAFVLFFFFENVSRLLPSAI